MSLLNWFSPKKKRQSHPSVLPGSDLSRLDSGKSHPHGKSQAAAPGQRKQERTERRELLYAVVREAMVRAGVLSSSYKFKVLSLDPRGRQFVVMVDLARGAASNTTRLAEIEAMIAQSAKARYDIVVGAVYWRANEHVAIGDAAHFTAHKPLISQPAPLGDHHAPASRPMPLGEPHAAASRPAPLAEHRASRPAPLSDDVSRPAELRAAPASSRAAHYEPLQADEVDAFRKALDAGVRGERALAAAHATQADKTQGQSYTLLTGFEDTEMAEGGESQLSGTQYGALR